MASNRPPRRFHSRGQSPSVHKGVAPPKLGEIALRSRPEFMLFPSGTRRHYVALEQISRS